MRAARRAEGGLPDRILVRAHRLAEREQLPAQLQGWTRSALAVLAALFALALFSGIGLALGALGDGARPVNVLWALGALLGLHALTFLLWLASFLLRPAAATGLGRLWLWVTRKLARGPDTALAPQALLNLLARAGALRWLFGSISHLLWLTGLCAALATLLTVLSTASYRFIWATTLLAPDTFVWLTQAIGWLPGLAGFPLPDAATVLASDGVQTLPATAQVQWSLWLIGVVVVYGVLPRLAAALLCWSCCGAGSPACASTPRCPATPRCATGWNPPWSPPAWTVPSTRCTSRACPRRRLPGWTAVRCCWLWNCPPTCPGRRPQRPPASRSPAGSTRARNAAASSTRWPTPPPRAS